MIVPVSGFGKGDPGPGSGRTRAKSDVEKMGNGNMADGKYAGRVNEDVMEGKAPEKTGALQKLRQIGGCIGYSAIFFASKSGACQKGTLTPALSHPMGEGE